MNKIIVRDLPSEDVGAMDILVVNENGEILVEDSLSGYDFSAKAIVELLVLTKQYAPFTLHFIAEDDVNKYLALAPISEYPEVDEDEEECEAYDDEYEDEDDEDYEDEEEADSNDPFYQPIIGDFEGDPCANCNDKGCALNRYVPPTVEALSSAIENASRD